MSTIQSLYIVILIAILIVGAVALQFIRKRSLRAGFTQASIKAIFNNATEGIILTNDTGRILLLNPAAAALFGYRSKELLGRQIELLIPGRYHDGHNQYRQHFNNAPSSRAMGQGRHLFAQRKDGAEFAVEVSLSHYKEKGQLYIIAFLIDITHRRLAEQELVQRKNQLEQITKDVTRLNMDLESKVEQRTLILREALDELEHSQAELSAALQKEKELHEIKSRFVTIASHEFRTPLSTVLSSASLLSKYKEAGDQDKRDRHIQRIRDSVAYLNELLNDLLSLGRLEEGLVRPEPTNFQVIDLLDETVDEIRVFARPGQEILVDCPQLGEFVSDRRLIKNILWNLMSNAVKFSPEGSVIRLEALRQEKGLLLSVTDQGIGVSEADQPRLFTSWFRASNAQDSSGTGLGLHLAKKYTDLLRGSIQFNSQLGKGTTVQVLLPSEIVQ